MKQPTKAKEHVTKILEVGKEKGYITYKQVNDILPDEVVSSEEIDDILLMTLRSSTKKKKLPQFQMVIKKSARRARLKMRMKTKKNLRRISKQPGSKPAWAIRLRCICMKWAVFRF